MPGLLTSTQFVAPALPPFSADLNPSTSNPTISRPSCHPERSERGRSSAQLRPLSARWRSPQGDWQCGVPVRRLRGQDSVEQRCQPHDWSQHVRRSVDPDRHARRAPGGCGVPGFTRKHERNCTENTKYVLLVFVFSYFRVFVCLPNAVGRSDLGPYARCAHQGDKPEVLPPYRRTALPPYRPPPNVSAHSPVLPLEAAKAAARKPLQEPHR